MDLKVATALDSEAEVLVPCPRGQAMGQHETEGNLEDRSGRTWSLETWCAASVEEGVKEAEWQQNNVRGTGLEVGTDPQLGHTPGPDLGLCALLSTLVAPAQTSWTSPKLQAHPSSRQVAFPSWLSLSTRGQRVKPELFISPTLPFLTSFWNLHFCKGPHFLSSPF